MREEKSKSGKVKVRNKALFIGIIGIVAIVLAVAAIGANANNNTDVSNNVNVPDVPHKINYQGYLTDAAGNPITGDRDMTFSIYDSSTGGTPLWSETQTSVRVEKGLFNVILGSVNPIPGDVFPSGGSRWLETEIEGQTLIPRKEIVSVAYAFKADPDGDWCGACTGEMYTRCSDNVSVIGGPGSYIKVGMPQEGYSTTFSYEYDGSMYDTYIRNPCGRGVGCDLILDFPYGNVGIGTTAPSEKLEVKGSGIRITSDKPWLRFHETDVPDKNGQIMADDGKLQIGFNDDTWSNFDPKIIIPNDPGNVDVHYTGNVCNSHVKLHFDRMQCMGGSSWHLGYDFNPFSMFSISRFAAVPPPFQWKYPFVIDEEGNIAIGALDRNDAPLDAVNDLDVKGRVGVGEGYAGNNIAPENGMIIEGKVGIGTTDPGEKLHVYDGATSAWIVVESNTDNAGITLKQRGRVPGKWGIMTVPVDGSLRIHQMPEGEDRLTIDQYGKVGVGTTTPQRMLHIKDVMRLEPRSAFPGSASNGDLCVTDVRSTGTYHIYCYLNGDWRQLD